MLNLRELFDPLREFLQPMVDRYGVKFLVVLAFIGSTTWLMDRGIVPGDLGLYVTGAVVAVFLIARTLQKKFVNNNSQNKKEDKQ